MPELPVGVIPGPPHVRRSGFIERFLLPDLATGRYSRAVARQRDTPSRLLRELRESRGASLRSTAESLQVAPSYLSRLERGERSYTPELRERIARYYGVKEDYLLLDGGDVPEDIAQILRLHPEEIDLLREKYPNAGGEHGDR